MTLRSSHSLVTAAAVTVFAQACSAGHTAGEPRAELIPAPEVGAAASDGRSPAALEALLAEYDRARGDDRERLAARVDEAAAQRYATVSRMFWYTDLDDARDASRATGKPILSLRMLGDLREDLSCANSRFFRVALYANGELSRWLRDHFVLHWSSERPVPKLTIDFGDGRQLATTIAGNSAHYVLDADGRVIDVLPGLMTPKAFRHELEPLIELADALGGADAPERARLLEEHHAGAVQAIDETWKLLGAAGVPEMTWGDSLAAAERRAMTKMRVEAPVVKTARLGADPSSVEVDSKVWEQLGVRYLAARGLEARDGKVVAMFGDDVDARILPPPVILDEQSRALLVELAALDDEHALAKMIQQFEASMVADTALNLLQLRRQVHEQLAGFARSNLPADFDAINAWVYSALFLTPASDPWLGMQPAGVFTGLPNG
jgi:hypothetical protein